MAAAARAPAAAKLGTMSPMRRMMMAAAAGEKKREAEAEEAAARARAEAVAAAAAVEERTLQRRLERAGGFVLGLTGLRGEVNNGHWVMLIGLAPVLLCWADGALCRWRQGVGGVGVGAAGAAERLQAAALGVGVGGGVGLAAGGASGRGEVCAHGVRSMFSLFLPLLLSTVLGLRSFSAKAARKAKLKKEKEAAKLKEKQAVKKEEEAAKLKEKKAVAAAAAALKQQLPKSAAARRRSSLTLGGAKPPPPLWTGKEEAKKKKAGGPSKEAKLVISIRTLGVLGAIVVLHVVLELMGAAKVLRRFFVPLGVLLLTSVYLYILETGPARAKKAAAAKAAAEKLAAERAARAARSQTLRDKHGSGKSKTS